jgi:hypothetical protein
VIKSVLEFNRERARKDGLAHHCKACQTLRYRDWEHRNPELVKTRSKEYFRNNYEKRAVHFIRQRYKFLTDEQAAVIANRRINGVCDCCHERITGFLNVDHDHQTNTFRGLICRHCNASLGFAKDDPVRLSKMIVYLERAPE